MPAILPNDRRPAPEPEPPYQPTPEEQAVLDRHEARRKTWPIAPQWRLKREEDGTWQPACAHPDRRVGQILTMDALGLRNTKTLESILGRLLMLSGPKDNPNPHRFEQLLGELVALEPKTELMTKTALQIVAVNDGAMTAAAWAQGAQLLPHITAATDGEVKLGKLQVKLVETYEKLKDNWEAAERKREEKEQKAEERARKTQPSRGEQPSSMTAQARSEAPSPSVPQSVPGSAQEQRRPRRFGEAIPPPPKRQPFVQPKSTPLSSGMQTVAPTGDDDGDDPPRPGRGTGAGPDPWKRFRRH